MTLNLLSSLSEKSIEELIAQLLQKGIDSFEEGKNEEQFKPRKTDFMQWKLENFEYTEEGVKSTSASGTHIQKEDWFLVQEKLETYLKSLDIYYELISKIQNKFSEDTLERLSLFVNLFFTKYFNDESFKPEIETYARAFVKDLKGEPTECGAHVELLGIAIETPDIDLKNGIVLRQIQRKDVEKLIPSYMISHQVFDSNYPSAIMDISLLGKQENDVQNAVNDAVTILRLFKVGSIRTKNYKIFSKSLNPTFLGTLGSLNTTRTANVGFIKKEEIEKLERFWDALKEKVIIFTRFGSHSSFIDISYQRYQESNLRNPESIERRITDCIMGFESIFLRDDGEKQEMVYRLKLRVARLLSKFGHDPFLVKRIIRDAYNIRSKFVHGGTLGHKDVKELEEKYQSITKLLLVLLDYLRIAIVVTLFLEIKKPAFIDIIDNSFLSEKYEKELDQILLQCKEIL